tara:strand:+ start:118 stop:333 length:216 start_codon:yes stop_codon:yes gene_type:complete
VKAGPAWALILADLVPAMRLTGQTVQGVANRYCVPDFEALQIIKLIQERHPVTIKIVGNVKVYRIIDAHSE